jgi:crotonobetainyl-CoA:carnitine CoA-transferase CaiB-like acyl-CoA transferase
MTQDYSVLEVTQEIFDTLIRNKKLPIPQQARDSAKHTNFYVPPSPLETDVVLPCPLKQLETVAALKGVEAAVANAIGQQRYGFEQTATIDLQHATMFLYMAYLATVNGLSKLDPDVKNYLKDTDLLAAQSNLYRRMSANLYKTKDGKYFHIHGSLEASTTLNMIGLPSHRDDLTDYREIIDYIESAVAKFTADELENLNKQNRQAGVTAITREEFLATPHGKAISSEPYWSVDKLESNTPPAPWKQVSNDSAPAAVNGNGISNGHARPQILAGIKVIELCRIVAGPTITRILAEYGVEVIKVTSPTLSDVPFFQIDGNMGKHTTDLDLKTPEGRRQFEILLDEADVVVDGYRPHAIEKLGFGPKALADRGQRRGKGYVYVSENCFGSTGEWAYRPGWQQIADCVTGVAWTQGRAMGRDEPIIPPFPMSDYGTGCLGAIAALVGLYWRATEGGSYWCNTSLVQYDLLLTEQGTYPTDVWRTVLDIHDKSLQDIRYYDSVDHISGTALQSMKRIRPDIFAEEGQKRYMATLYAPGFGATVQVLKPVVHLDKTDNRFNGPSRPNGYDEPTWWL